MDFKKLFLLIVLIVSFGAGFVNAFDEPQWFGSGGGAVDPGIIAVHNRNWFDPNNWRLEVDPSGLPTTAAMVKVNQVWNNDGPVIWGPVTISQLKVSESPNQGDGGPQSASVTTGGDLSTGLQIFLGWNGPFVDPRAGTLPGNEGTFIQTGGLTRVGDNMNVGGSADPLARPGGIGHLKIYGGDLNIGGTLAGQLMVGVNGGHGDVTVSGGVLHSAQFSLSPASPATASMNICGGTWIQENDFRAALNTLIANGTIKAYDGKGLVNVAWDPLPGVGNSNENGRQVITAIASLWDANNITITNNSPVIVPPATPNVYLVQNMFESGLSQDSASTVFSDGSTPGAVYFVEWNTFIPAKINTFDIHLQSDAGSYNRATKHVKIRAKSLGSSAYDQTIFDADVNTPYAGPNYVVDIVKTLTTPITAQYFRAEFTADLNAAAGNMGPRILELNATGTYLYPGGHEWNYEKMLVDLVSSDKTVDKVGHALKSMFQGGVDTNDTIFLNYDPANPAALYPAGHIYGVNWSMPKAITLGAFTLKAAHDGAPSYIRAMSHFTLKAKSGGSPTFDRTIYSTAVAVPYDFNNGPIGKLITLAHPVIARDFRAEFTSHDVNAPRILELDGIGYDSGTMAADIDASYSVDFKDYAQLARNWKSTQTLKTIPDCNFEIASLPISPAPYPTAGTWCVDFGHTSLSGGFFNTMPTIALATGIAHGGNKALQLNYCLYDAFDPCSAYNSVTYALKSPVNLSSSQAFNVWIKRAATNLAEIRFDVRFLRSHKILAYSNVIAGGAADANSLWTQVNIPINALNTDGRTIDLLTAIDAIQFCIVGPPDPTSADAGTIYFDDLSFAPVVAGDLNGDGKVDFLDLMLFTPNWLAGK